ncbi:thiamine-phosphate kinase [Heliophilum fasciatum]|uniref:Multifunctional fusion protein n=1 Tax=Heliophilum fasciatum TaxID=35700 RepID=A0A4R2S0J6_9FIRM|nr:thiamine-phosphate kinase [Heliophilum fasciatum]MCW2276680.1 thiamin-phosphate kinase [Heliophilum fasciatum]TCP68939.1 thiamin-phosphate kinase [Heliophilum fasciatum]
MKKPIFWPQRLPWTYLVTDRALCQGRPLTMIVEQALRGGVKVVQYREKTLPTREMIAEASQLKDLCERYGALFVVNDRIDVALAVAAPAIHLGQEDMPIKHARAILGDDVLIGISASSVEEAQIAERDGADYIGASAVFATPTKEEAPALGLAGLKAICQAVSVPVVAIGGLHLGNVSDVIEAGSAGVAVVSAIMAASDPEAAAQALVQQLEAYRYQEESQETLAVTEETNGSVTRTPLSAVGEFGLIARLQEAWEKGGRESTEGAIQGETLEANSHDDGAFQWFPSSPLWGLRLGIGDDAAVLDFPAGKRCLVTTDMLVEDVHFIWHPERIHLLGRKALAVNISDIAAMGGRPGWAFLSIGVPPHAAVEEVEELYAGMGAVAADYGVLLSGGDTICADKWILNITLIGVAKGEPITRGGGRPGDFILVTGTVGDSAIGLQELLRPHHEFPELAETSGVFFRDDASFLLARHFDPTPRVPEALLLAAHGGVTAMMDVSDGISSEVHHLCRASRCGAQIDLTALPISPAAQRWSQAKGESVLPFALTGGEDYELIFTASPAAVPGLMASIQAQTGTTVTVIGQLTEPEAGITAVHPDIDGGAPNYLPAKGFNHFLE